MKSILQVAFAACLAVLAGTVSANAQTVVLDGLGSSALFLEAGLGAASSGGAIIAPCVWSENTNAVIASDTSVPSFTLQDKGSAWVAWTTGGLTPNPTNCATPGSGYKIYAYLSTDSVVGNRCLFHSNLAPSKCSIAYPTSPAAPANQILTGGTVNCGTTGECNLPPDVIIALNQSTQLVNYAATDIRPEDALAATSRALTNCGTRVASGSQILGLGYSNGSTINGFPGTGGGSFNVINFSLPSTFTVIPVGATPIIVAVNDTAGTGLGAYSGLSVAALADFLDGTFSYTGQVANSPSATGSAVTAYIREPLSGTYNTMEFNAANTTTAQTSQDVGLNQPLTQANCTITSTWPEPATTISTVLQNPMDFTTPSGGFRQRAIGTGKELAAVAANGANSIGYGFWSAANFAGLAAVTGAKYYIVGDVDPLGKNGVLPTGSALSTVSLASTADGKYPLWSMLRLVNVGAANSDLAALGSSTQTFATGTHKDFVAVGSMFVVRSHFNPPGQSVTPSDGSGSLSYGSNKAGACSGTETGGDVGGVVIGLNTASLTQSPLTLSDETYCGSTSTAGQTGHRR